jgi:hypothetical protein
MDRDKVLQHIGELSLMVFNLNKEIEARDQEISKLRILIEKLSSKDDRS